MKGAVFMMIYISALEDNVTMLAEQTQMQLHACAVEDSKMRVKDRHKTEQWAGVREAAPASPSARHSNDHRPR